MVEAWRPLSSREEYRQMGLDVLGAAYIFQIPTLLNVRVLRFDRGRLATVRRAKDPQDARVLAARKKAQ